MKRPLVGLQAIHVLGIQGEVGPAILKENPGIPGHHGRTERKVQGLDQRNRVSLFVDHTEENRVAAEVSGMDRGQLHGPVRPDERPALGGVVFGKKQVRGQGHLFRVGDVMVAVGEGEFLGLHHQMGGVGRKVAHRGKVEAFQEIQDQKGGDALGIGRGLKDGEAAIGGRGRFPPGGFHVLKIFFTQQAAVLLKKPGDCPADFPAIENIPSFPGDLLQVPGQIGVGQNGSRTGRLASREKEGGGIWKLRQFGRSLIDFETEDVRDGKAFPGVSDSRFEDGGYGQHSVSAMGFEPPIHRAGDGHRQNPPQGNRGHAAFLKKFHARGIGRATARIQEGQVLFGCVVDQPESIASDPAHVRIDHVEDGIRGDGGIHGGPALFQDIDSGLGCQIVGGGHHSMGGHGDRTVLLGKCFGNGNFHNLLSHMNLILSKSNHSG